MKIYCLICKKNVGTVKNNLEQLQKVKTGNDVIVVCNVCQAKILFEAKNKGNLG